MKKSLPILATALLTAVFLTAGCESTGVTTRIQEKSAVFNALTPAQQQSLQDGMISVGDTPDMAYIALGKPSKTEIKDTAGGKVEMWTYSKYYPSGKMETALTEYSRARNPNLERSLNIEKGVVVNNNTPGSNPTGNRKSTGASTGTSSNQGVALSLPDVPVYNLYLFFSEGKIVDVQLESLDGTAL